MSFPHLLTYNCTHTAGGPSIGGGYRGPGRTSITNIYIGSGGCGCGHGFGMPRAMGFGAPIGIGFGVPVRVGCGCSQNNLLGGFLDGFTAATACVSAFGIRTYNNFVNMIHPYTTNIGMNIGLSPMQYSFMGLNPFSNGNIYTNGNSFSVGSTPSSTPSSRESSYRSRIVEDRDVPVITDFKTQVDELLGKATLTDEDKAKAKALYKEIEAKKAHPVDDIYAVPNELSYDDLLVKLKEKFPDIDKESTPSKPDSTPDANIAKNNGLLDKDGNPIKTINGLDGINEADIKALTKPDAIDALKNLGLINGNEVKFLNNYKVLLLAEKSGLTVNVANNPNSEDKWIKGKITNVEIDQQGKISFKVDNKDVPNALFGYKYTFKACDNSNEKFNVTNIDKNGSNKVGYALKDFSSRVYEFNKQDRLKYTGEPLVSQWKNPSTRTEVQ